ncbi:MAG: ABC transporter substrate-binding protein [Ilumatobacteraceae bacterium]
MLVPLAALAVGLAACGGDDDGETTATTGAAATTAAGGADTTAASETTEASETTGASDTTAESETTTASDGTDAETTEPESTDAETTEPMTTDGVTTTAGGGGAAPSGDPILIGVNTTLTGPLGVYGESINEAVQFAVDEVNAEGGVLGRPVEVASSENDGTPESAVQGVERVVQQDGATFVTGPITSAQVIAISERLEALDAVFVNVTSKSDQVTGAACNARLFQITSSDSMDLQAMTSAIEGSGVPNWAVLAADFAIGYDSVETFTAAAEAAGQTVSEPLFAPPGTEDYGTYITQLQESGADGLWLTLIGGDAVTFLTQASQFGLFDNFSVVMGTNTVTEPLFPALGPYIEGFVGPFSYYRTAVETPENEEFVTAWEETYGDQPYFVDADTYTGMQVLFQAIEAAGTDEPQAVADAMASIEADSVYGTVTMRPGDHQLLRPTFVGSVVSAEGGLGWEVQSAAPAEETSPEPNPECQL